MTNGAGEVVQIETPYVTLEGNLNLPANSQGVVLFVHGSGSSRHSPRNQYVAQVLSDGGLGTLLIDLLSAEEEAADRDTSHLRSDIDLLANRLVGATDWLTTYSDSRHLRVGYFGASTGAAATLVAAAERPDQIRAVVSRGGRPDLAADSLARVEAPTLLIVGGLDSPVARINQEALALLKCKKQLELVPDATHLFEEPGALESVANLALRWFRNYL